jgi:hypothetical protein
VTRRRDETTWYNMHPEARRQIADILRDVITKAKREKMEDNEKRGIIRGISGSGSILRIKFEDPQTGKINTVNAENGPTVRALIGLFGSEITRDHTLLVEKVLGQEVGYDTDDLGLLAYVTE